MREIKFRGKSVDTGKWIYGYLIGDNVIVGNIVEFNDEYFNTSFWQKVHTETVGQDTGLKDKNGKEIYEGDRFKQKKSIGTIEYQDDSFIIDWDDPCPDNWNEHLRHHAKNGEVIGNIYENAEVLK